MEDLFHGSPSHFADITDYFFSQREHNGRACAFASDAMLSSFRPGSAIVSGHFFFHDTERDAKGARQNCTGLIRFTAYQGRPGWCRIKLSVRMQDWPEFASWWEWFRGEMIKDGLMDLKRGGTGAQRKRKPRPGTQEKLDKLSEVRREKISRGRVQIGRMEACYAADIDPNTAKEHNPELWEKWDDPNYS